MSLLGQPLKAFLAIVETGTVHRAAEVIGLSQTGVTQRIRSLEKELNATLFIRSRKGMKLTAEGEALFQYCKGVKDLEGQLLSRVRGETLDEELELHVIGPTSIMSTRIAEACVKIHEKYPHLIVHLQADDFANRVAAVKSGLADFAIVSPADVPNEMDSKRLKPDRFVLVASSNWKGRSLKEIVMGERMIDFYESDETTLRYLKAFGLTPGNKKRLFIDDNSALIYSLIHGLGYGTLTQEVAQPFLERGELIALNRGQTIEEQNALIWYPRPQMPDYLQVIIRTIQ